MAIELPFKENDTLSVGIELELQLINLHHFDLAMEAEDYLRRLSNRPCSSAIKPEITQSMIEINSSVHTRYEDLLQELKQTRNIMAEEAHKTHIGVCGGGTHPFQKWKKRRIFQTERFASLSEQYGYLAKQFTVFGQHIHIGCANGNDAIYLCHAMARYIPQFIALSASSPYNQGVDTAFDCSRLAVVDAFPLNGTPPWLHTWREFEDYFNKLQGLGIVKTLKDFYWDIRPKPEFGTVELRVCDTPLSIHRAAILGGYAQTLAAYLLDSREPLNHDIYLSYLTNRFRATRYGFEAEIIDAANKSQDLLADDILETCQKLRPYAEKLESTAALDKVIEFAKTRRNGSAWLRSCFALQQSLADTVRLQSELWMNPSDEP